MCEAEDELREMEANLDKLSAKAAENAGRLCDAIEDFARGLISQTELEAAAREARREVYA